MPVSGFGKTLISSSSYSNANNTFPLVTENSFLYQTGGLIHFLICHLHMLHCGKQHAPFQESHEISLFPNLYDIK